MLIRFVCVFVLIHSQGRFSNRCVFDENALRFSVDERFKRTEMYKPAKTAVSVAKREEKRLFSQAKMYSFKREYIKLNPLLMRFQTKTH